MSPAARDAIIAGLAALAAGLATWAACDHPVTCPTEDSCSVDYRHGQWVVERDVP